MPVPMGSKELFMKEVRLGTIGSNFITHNILDGVMLTEGITLEAL